MTITPEALRERLEKVLAALEARRYADAKALLRGILPLL